MLDSVFTFLALLLHVSCMCRIPFWAAKHVFDGAFTRFGRGVEAADSSACGKMAADRWAVGDEGGRCGETWTCVAVDEVEA